MVEYTIDAHGGPKLSSGDTTRQDGQQTAEGAPVIGLVQPPGWTPQEIEAQLMGVWFFAWVGVCLVKWKRPDFAVNFAAGPGEFSASATALVPVFDQYVPKQLGGPGGALFAAPIVAGEVIQALMRRGPLLAAGPPPEAAAPPPGTQRPAAAPDESPSSGSYRIPTELRPPAHGFEVV